MGRILAIRSEGFFKTQRSLGEVRESLGSRGWHYPLTTLSGVMQALGQAGVEIFEPLDQRLLPA